MDQIELNNLPTDELIQHYLNALYFPFTAAIQQGYHAEGNELYGEIHYYSAKKLLSALKLQTQDHFMDVGSGFGRVVLQGFLTENIQSATGIEINPKRHDIAVEVAAEVQKTLPGLFKEGRTLNFINGDFLDYKPDDVTVLYICSLAFSLPLLEGVGEKINQMKSVKRIASVRKIPNLQGFDIREKLFLHGTWDRFSCYIYARAGTK